LLTETLDTGVRRLPASATTVSAAQPVDSAAPLQVVSEPSDLLFADLARGLRVDAAAAPAVPYYCGVARQSLDEASTPDTTRTDSAPAPTLTSGPTKKSGPAGRDNSVTDPLSEARDDRPFDRQ